MTRADILSWIEHEAPNAAIVIAIGLIGALCARALGGPMPFLMGSLASVGACAAIRTARGYGDLRFPRWFRNVSVGMIGAMIGASFSRELMASLPSIWPSILGMVVFVSLVLAIGFAMFRYLGGYDPVTSVFAAMPGGLVEAVSLGEAAGGDVRALALQHFARIVVVVVMVPLLYLYWTGSAVGSASGQSFDAGPWAWRDVIALFALVFAGFWIGPHLRLPAPHMVGPMVLSAALCGAGLIEVARPTWLLAIAQLLVGAGLGVRFSGAGVRDLLRGFGLAALYVAVILVVAGGFARAFSQITPFDFDTLFVSFAPGGVTEMGLVALSLGISPVVVAVHHIFRIIFTVAVAGWLAKRWGGATNVSADR